MKKNCNHEWEPTDNQGHSMECTKCGKPWNIYMDEVIERSFKDNHDLLIALAGPPDPHLTDEQAEVLAKIVIEKNKKNLEALNVEVLIDQETGQKEVTIKRKR
jgi:hypothetical protein